MRTYFTILLLGAFVSFLVTPLARRLAFLVGAVDQPDPRKIHREPTPRLGGLAIVAGFCLPWLLLFFVDNRVAALFHEHERLLFVLLGAALTMFTVGVVDDIHGVSARGKLLVQVLVAVAMYWGDFRINLLSNPFGSSVELGWWSLPITVIWIVGLTNATNLLDGMDGLVAGVVAVMSLTLAMIHIIDNNFVVALLAFTLAGATLGFLPYNFAPARIFLGDSGSLFLGLLMAGLSTISLFKAATVAMVFVPLLVFALPLIDTTQVVIGRIRSGRHPFSPDKTHVHHRLLELGLDQKQVVLVLYLISLFLGVVAIVLSRKTEAKAAMALIAMAVVVCTGLVVWTRKVSARPPTETSPPHEESR